MSNKMIDIKYLKHRIEVLTKRVEELNKLKEKGILTNHGYWSLGYYEGIISTFQNHIDEVEGDDKE